MFRLVAPMTINREQKIMAADEKAAKLSFSVPNPPVDMVAIA